MDINVVPNAPSLSEAEGQRWVGSAHVRSRSRDCRVTGLSARAAESFYYKRTMTYSG